MYGIDIAKQRLDEQDRQIIAHATTAEWKNKRALILAAGEGRIGIVLALLGFEVVCADIDDYSSFYTKANQLFSFTKPIIFIRQDLNNITPDDLPGEFSLVLLQRVLHYLPYDSARSLLGILPKIMSKGSFLYSAVSCIDSEMASGYEGIGQSIETRYAKLSTEMQRRFSLTVPVCLFTLPEYKKLMSQTHFKKKKIYQTSFGNIKSLFVL